jgi:hypothetical protein
MNIIEAAKLMESGKVLVSEDGFAADWTRTGCW